MKIVIRRLLIAAALILPVQASFAGFIDAAVPSNAYISFGGSDWAWASPCDGSDPSCGDVTLLSFQASQGWRLPTAAEILSAPSAFDFLFAGGNVPFNGVDPISLAQFQATNANYDAARSAGACAAPYFSDDHRHCDWSNGQDGGDGFNWWSPANSNLGLETLVIRDQQGPSIPEPGSMALLALGAAGLGITRRKKGKNAR